MDLLIALGLHFQICYCIQIFTTAKLVGIGESFAIVGIGKNWDGLSCSNVLINHYRNLSWYGGVVLGGEKSPCPLSWKF